MRGYPTRSEYLPGREVPSFYMERTKFTGTASPSGWWWLSFVDGGFLGGLLIEGATIVDACRNAHLAGLNPGGEVLGVALTPAAVVATPRAWRRRLLTKAECESLDGRVTQTIH